MCGTRPPSSGRATMRSGWISQVGGCYGQASRRAAPATATAQRCRPGRAAAGGAPACHLIGLLLPSMCVPLPRPGCSHQQDPTRPGVDQQRQQPHLAGAHGVRCVRRALPARAAPYLQGSARGHTSLGWHGVHMLLLAGADHAVCSHPQPHPTACTLFASSHHSVASAATALCSCRCFLLMPLLFAHARCPRRSCPAGATHGDTSRGRTGRGSPKWWPRATRLAAGARGRGSGGGSGAAGARAAAEVGGGWQAGGQGVVLRCRSAICTGRRQQKSYKAA